MWHVLRTTIWPALSRHKCSFSAAGARRTHERNEHTTSTETCPLATTVLWQANLDYLRPSRLPEHRPRPRTEDGLHDASTARETTMQAHGHEVSSGSGEMAMAVTGSPAPMIPIMSSLPSRTWKSVPTPLAACWRPSRMGPTIPAQPTTVMSGLLVHNMRTARAHVVNISDRSKQ